MPYYGSVFTCGRLGENSRILQHDASVFSASLLKILGIWVRKLCQNDAETMTVVMESGMLPAATPFVYFTADN